MYGSFYLTFKQYLSVFKRAFSVWKRIEKFLFNNFGHHILNSLINGEPESSLNQVQSRGGFEFTLGERIIYRLCGGQTKKIGTDWELNRISGLFGGYKFYE